MLRDDAEKRTENYDESCDKNLAVEEDPERTENANPLFRAGQSHRVWGELYKVYLLKFFKFCTFTYSVST